MNLAEVRRGVKAQGWPLPKRPEAGRLKGSIPWMFVAKSLYHVVHKKTLVILAA